MNDSRDIRSMLIKDMYIRINPVPNKLLRIMECVYDICVYFRGSICGHTSRNVNKVGIKT